MKTRVFGLLIPLLLCAVSTIGQESTVHIRVQPVWNGAPLALEKTVGTTGKEITFSKMRWYIGQVALEGERGVAVEDKKAYHLLDLSDPTTLEWTIPLSEKGTSKAIQFNLGVDSTTSASGAFGGDLDPMHGMYWAWNSGYINVKLEGTSPQCPARNHHFDFHLGGYATPHNSMQQVRLECPASNALVINIDLAMFFESVDLEHDYRVMSPSSQAVELSQLLAKSFSVHEAK